MDRELRNGAKATPDTSEVVIVSMHHPLNHAVPDVQFIGEVDHVSIIIIDPSSNRSIFILMGIPVDMMANTNENAAQLFRSYESFDDYLLWEVLPHDVTKATLCNRKEEDLAKKIEVRLPWPITPEFPVPF